jgi:hypothetical protein
MRTFVHGILGGTHPHSPIDMGIEANLFSFSGRSQLRPRLSWDVAPGSRPSGRRTMRTTKQTETEKETLSIEFFFSDFAVSETQKTEGRGVPQFQSGATLSHGASLVNAFWVKFLTPADRRSAVFERSSRLTRQQAIDDTFVQMLVDRDGHRMLCCPQSAWKA